MEFKSLRELVRIVENSLFVQFDMLNRLADMPTTGVLRKSVFKVLAAVVGGALHLLVLIEKKIWKNAFVWSCDVDRLDGFGTEYGVPHKPPMYATGYARVVLASGTSSVSIPEGTVITDSSSSLEYEVITTTTVTNSAKDVPVRALVYGADSNLDDGVALEFRDVDIAGVESMSSKDIAGGALFVVLVNGDVQGWGETAEMYRARLQNRIQNPVNGGSKNDYWTWATRHQFVTDAYIIPQKPNVNSVSVAIANYNSDNIVCTAGQVEEVKGYLTSDARRPVGADVHVFSVTPVLLEISASVTPFNDAVKESVTDAIKRYFRGVDPGQTVYFENLRLYVRSNSLAESFRIDSVVKDGNSVSEILFALTFPSDPDDPVVAEVADCSVTLKNGDI